MYVGVRIVGRDIDVNICIGWGGVDSNSSRM